MFYLLLGFLIFVYFVLFFFTLACEIPTRDYYEGFFLCILNAYNTWHIVGAQWLFAFEGISHPVSADSRGEETSFINVIPKVATEKFTLPGGVGALDLSVRFATYFLVS